MKVKIGQLKKADQVLGEMIKQELPIQMEVVLARAIRVLSTDHMPIITKRETKILDKYKAEDKENEGAWIIPEDKREKFEDEYAKLMDEELEVEIKPISVSKYFRENERVPGIKTMDILAVDWLFAE